MTRSRTPRTALAAVTTAALALGLGACSSDDASTSGSTGSDDKKISIGVHAGWDEGIAVSHLFKAMLEDDGYTVDEETADPGVVYTGLAGGSYDLNFDMWLPATHADYLKKYGDDLEQLGVWYDDARLTIAVNEDAPITSLAELGDAAEQFGDRLVGIEAGAGLTRITQDEVVPTYGLDSMDFRHLVDARDAR